MQLTTQYQPFATAITTKREESPLDVLFKNMLTTDFPFKNLDHGFKTGYPLDIFYQDLEGPNPTLNFEFALPGVEPSDVEITKTKDGELRVKYEAQKSETPARDYFSRTISKRAFDLVWKIPRRFDLQKMEAKFKNGLLSISIPRSSDSIPESVEIVTE